MEKTEMKSVQLKKLKTLRNQLREPSLVRFERERLIGELNGRTELLYELSVLTRRESDDEYVKTDVTTGAASPKVLNQ